jgi:hypothetical protein
MTAINGATSPASRAASRADSQGFRLSNVGVAMVHVYSRQPYYADLLARCRREDRRLSLIEHCQMAIWIPVEWLEEWQRCHGK